MDEESAFRVILMEKKVEGKPNGKIYVKLSVTN